MKGQCPRPLDEGANKNCLEERTYGIQPSTATNGPAVPTLGTAYAFMRSSKKFGTSSRTRTGTSKGHKILSLGRLPIPPYSHKIKKKSTMSKNSQSLDYVLTIRHIEDNVKQILSTLKLFRKSLDSLRNRNDSLIRDWSKTID